MAVSSTCVKREVGSRSTKESVEFNEHWHAIVMLLRSQTIIPRAMGERAHDKWAFCELIACEYVNDDRPITEAYRLR
jgi:hypothetical protein